jgi:hypothetical protein
VGADRRGGVTGRVVAVAVVLVVTIAALNFFVEVLWGAGSWTGVGWSSGVPAATPLIFLIGLTALGSLPVLRRFILRRAAHIYAIPLVCARAHPRRSGVDVVKNAATLQRPDQHHWQTMFLPVPTVGAHRSGGGGDSSRPCVPGGVRRRWWSAWFPVAPSCAAGDGAFAGDERRLAFLR